MNEKEARRAERLAAYQERMKVSPRTRRYLAKKDREARVERNAAYRRHFAEGRANAAAQGAMRGPTKARRTREYRKMRRRMAQASSRRNRV